MEAFPATKRSERGLRLAEEDGLNVLMFGTQTEISIRQLGLWVQGAEEMPEIV